MFLAIVIFICFNFGGRRHEALAFKYHTMKLANQQNEQHPKPQPHKPTKPFSRDPKIDPSSDISTKNATWESLIFRRILTLQGKLNQQSRSNFPYLLCVGPAECAHAMSPPPPALAGEQCVLN